MADSNVRPQGSADPEIRISLKSPDQLFNSQAVHEQFRRRSETVSRELRELLRRGGISAVIGAAFLAATVLAGDLISRLLGQSHTNAIIQEGLQLLGWVSTWRPSESSSTVGGRSLVSASYSTGSAECP